MFQLLNMMSTGFRLLLLVAGKCSNIYLYWNWFVKVTFLDVVESREVLPVWPSVGTLGGFDTLPI
jgi:uncharacterized membrane protein (UPF0182 family)